MYLVISTDPDRGTTTVFIADMKVRQTMIRPVRATAARIASSPGPVEATIGTNSEKSLNQDPDRDLDQTVGSPASESLIASSGYS